jgi:hypothetical protein
MYCLNKARFKLGMRRIINTKATTRINEIEGGAFLTFSYIIQRTFYNITNLPESFTK